MSKPWIHLLGAVALAGALTACGSTRTTPTDDQPKEAPTSADAEKAAEVYADYVEQQATSLIKETEAFVAAVKAGNVAEAKRLFPIARTYWERIEPVAEVFGDLDPLTDGREPDAKAEGRDFTGWHRIEKQLWVDGNTQGMGKYADELLANIRKVVKQSADQPLTALQLAEGSKGLLDEVASSKITGEEDEFSHTDLWDFKANIEGSEAAIEALRPLLEHHDAVLAKELDDRFTAVNKELGQYQAADGSWASYETLTKPQVKKLSDAVAALSEPISKVAGVVGKAS
jgi:iron uptake system component EfeO